MSFLAPAPTTDDGVVIKNDGFFPDIDLDAMRDTQRLDGTVTTVRLQAEVVEAMLHANAELSAWRALREAEGYTSLADVKRVDGRPVPEVGGKTALELRYTRAVYCWANANLIERYRNFDATATARKEDEVSRPGADELRRDAAWAINDIAGQRRITVELI
ncbi:hypothetical protein LV28_12255 [Pandoraea pnomenusa]|uniref:Phage head completion protein (GPL) n=1 Tax=Pandoraea pnomenusa TaxID=93220 RepID=A0A378YNQ1_9BURK|nr:head completion/stabilization protein [Pandoraea pnomenusa]AIU27193.1 hypothetical protein LV28_12255 [Pandoraea pnomenusa]SUA78220.1 Phage head completion protein (GPL) [Pandoraea pnomenusa]